VYRAKWGTGTLPIRLRVGELLEKRGWTPYRLAKETQLTLPVAYRLTDPSHVWKRLDLDTLEVLCRTLNVQPGDLLEYVPDKKVTRAKR
jgi:putative transcriptional regulator